MRPNPDAVYLEPTAVWRLPSDPRELTTPMGVTIHWKEGARWQELLLLPNEDESFGDLLGRLGSWIEDAPLTWTSELLHGSGRYASHD